MRDDDPQIATVSIKLSAQVISHIYQHLLSLPALFTAYFPWPRDATAFPLVKRYDIIRTPQSLLQSQISKSSNPLQ